TSVVDAFSLHPWEGINGSHVWNIDGVVHYATKYRSLNLEGFTYSLAEAKGRNIFSERATSPNFWQWTCFTEVLQSMDKRSKMYYIWMDWVNLQVFTNRFLHSPNGSCK
ncbi:MAG: hypothetical protein ACTS6P_02215, partial [Candidatus Hodgkinia cicadicola]